MTVRPFLGTERTGVVNASPDSGEVPTVSRPDATRAAVLRGFGEPMTIEEVPLPRELEPGALLVEVVASTLGGTDVHLAWGELSLPVNLPVILGPEMASRVVEVGPGAHTDSFGRPVRVGDRVIWAHAFCGSCAPCTTKMPAVCANARRYGFPSPTTFPYAAGGHAAHCCVFPNAGRAVVPDAVPDSLASMGPCALRTVVHAVRPADQVDATTWVVVQGCGPLGVLATGMLRVGGAGTVITVGGPDARLGIAAEFGADSTIGLDNGAEDRVERVRELTDGGADLVFDFSGDPPAFAEGIDMLRTGGRDVVVGQLGSATTPIAPGAINTKHLTVQGVMSADIEHYDGGLRFLERYRDNLPFDRLISQQYPLEDINTALESMRALAEMKPLIVA